MVVIDLGEDGTEDTEYVVVDTETHLVLCVSLAALSVYMHNTRSHEMKTAVSWGEVCRMTPSI